MTIDDLAGRVGTSGTQIRRLEAGARRLTIDWMRKIAEALQCSPADLIATASLASSSEVEPAALEMASLANAIRARGMSVYRVLGTSVTESGILPGDVITVDEAPAAIAAAVTGDIVLVEIAEQPPLLALRLLVRPSLLTTNRPGNNISVRLDDPSIRMTIRGVLIRA